MKILKYIIFLSILSGLFLVIYRQSDKKGFRRWWISFRIAAFIAAVLAGLILPSTEVIEPDVSNNSPSIERVLSNQEFNSLEENDRQVILAKAEGSNPVTPPTTRSGPSNFPTPPSGGRPSRTVPGVNPYRTAPRVVDQGLGAAANPAGAGGGGGGAAEFEDNSPVPKKEQSQKSKIFDSDYRPNDPKKKKKSEDQCSIYEQNKGGIDELPDSSEFIYNLEGKSAKQELRKVWKNTEAQKEVLAGLEKMNKGELVPRNQKALQGFKNLKEVKLNKTRIIVNPGKNGAPDQIVGIVMRKHLENFTTKLAKKFK